MSLCVRFKDALVVSDTPQGAVLQFENVKINRLSLNPQLFDQDGERHDFTELQKQKLEELVLQFQRWMVAEALATMMEIESVD